MKADTINLSTANAYVIYLYSSLSLAGAAYLQSVFRWQFSKWSDARLVNDSNCFESLTVFIYPRKKHSVSSASSPIKLQHNFVQRIPADENACFASTDVGGTDIK